MTDVGTMERQVTAGALLVEAARRDRKLFVYASRRTLDAIERIRAAEEARLGRRVTRSEVALALIERGIAVEAGRSESRTQDAGRN